MLAIYIQVKVYITQFIDGYKFFLLGKSFVGLPRKQSVVKLGNFFPVPSIYNNTKCFLILVHVHPTDSQQPEIGNFWCRICYIYHVIEDTEKTSSMPPL